MTCFSRDIVDVDIAYSFRTRDGDGKNYGVVENLIGDNIGAEAGESKQKCMEIKDALRNLVDPWNYNHHQFNCLQAIGTNPNTYVMGSAWSGSVDVDDVPAMNDDVDDNVPDAQVYPSDCDEIAAQLNDLLEEQGVTGRLTCSFPLQNGFGFLTSVGGGYSGCTDVTDTLSSLIAAYIEKPLYTSFYKATAGILGTVAVISLLCAVALGGESDHEDDGPCHVLSAGALVCLRLFDFLSDWGFYGISLASEHRKTSLRTASCFFSIVGTILLVFDIGAVVIHYCGNERDASSYALIKVAIAILEDFPQLIMACVFVAESTASRGFVDPIAVLSIVFSSLSLCYNLSVCCWPEGCTAEPAAEPEPEGIGAIDIDLEA